MTALRPSRAYRQPTRRLSLDKCSADWAWATRARLGAADYHSGKRNIAQCQPINRRLTERLHRASASRD